MTDNVVWQPHKIGKAERSRRNGQKPCVLWFTGLSGSGKSTISDALEVRLHEMGFLSYLLDGDNVRHGLNKDLGFSDVDRVENIRRIAEVSKLFVDAGLIVLTAFISPFRADREGARAIMGADEFVEIHLDTPLAVCELRDPKGLYRKARAGEILNFTGIDSVYEPPEHPEIRLDTSLHTVSEGVEHLVSYLTVHGYLSRDGA
jgi:adenylyl-sulfate kinase